RFNRRFGATFPVPEAIIGKQGARIMSLDDPTEKMSKSSTRPASSIGMLDDLASVRRKIARAVTDSGSTVAYGPDHPAVSNLLEILAGVTGESIPDLVAGLEGQGYARLKSDLAEAVVAVLEPFQARYAELMGDPAMLDKLLEGGADKARAVAEPTMALVVDRAAASSFLALAAALLELESLKLVRREEADPETAALLEERDRLLQRLVEYATFKGAADALSWALEANEGYFTRTGGVPDELG